MLHACSGRAPKCVPDVLRICDPPAHDGAANMPHAHKFASVRCERWLASGPTSRDDTRTHMHRNACRSHTRCALHGCSSSSMCPCASSASSTSSGPASSFHALSRAQSRSVPVSGTSGAAASVCGTAAAARGRCIRLHRRGSNWLERHRRRCGRVLLLPPLQLLRRQLLRFERVEGALPRTALDVEPLSPSLRRLVLRASLEVV